MNRSNPYAWLLPLSALALAAGILQGRSAANLWPGGAALVCAMVAVWLCPGKGRQVALLAAEMALGSMLGYAAYHPKLPAEGEYLITGVITDDIRQRENRQVRTILRSVTLEGEAVPGGAYWTFYLKKDEVLPEFIVPGATVTMRARVYHPSGAENPGGYDFRENLLQQSITIGVYGRDDLAAVPASFHLLGFAARCRHELTQRLVAIMGEEAGGYAATMVLGSRNLLPDADRQAFSSLGIAHVLSVSGFHVGVLAWLIRCMLRRLHLSRRVRLVVTGTVLLIYCMLVGLSAPVVRAALLYLLWEVGALMHRPRSSLHLLAASWVLILVGSPTQLTSGSFQLTFGAMLGLVLVSPWLQRLHTFRHKWQQKQWQGVCTGVGAQVGILLPQLYIFHEIPLLGVALNLLVISLASVLIGLCWVVLFLLPVQPLAQLAGGAAAWMIRILLLGVRAMGAWEGLTLWTSQANILTALGWCMLMAAMSLWWPGRRRRMPALLAGIVIIALSVTPLPYRQTTYMQFSVGDADAALLHDHDQVVVVDTGEDGLTLSGYLHQRRLSIDTLILTHLHTDHAGGVRALLDDGIPITTCCLPWDAEQADIDDGMLALVEELAATGTQLVYLKRGDELALPSGSLRVLWPEEGTVPPGRDANESSMAMLATLHNTTLLLTGDLDGRYEDAAAVPADVLKVAHHGSKNSTSQAFLENVQPELLLLSRSTDARRVSMDERRGDIPIRDTKTEGAITLHIDENGYTVTTFR